MFTIITTKNLFISPRQYKASKSNGNEVKEGVAMSKILNMPLKNSGRALNWTSDLQSRDRGFDFRSDCDCIVTVGKLFTPLLCPCHKETV